MANIVKVDEIEGCELQWQGRKVQSSGTEEIQRVFDLS